MRGEVRTLNRITRNRHRADPKPLPLDRKREQDHVAAESTGLVIELGVVDRFQRQSMLQLRR